MKSHAFRQSIVSTMEIVRQVTPPRLPMTEWISSDTRITGTTIFGLLHTLFRQPH